MVRVFHLLIQVFFYITTVLLQLVKQGCKCLIRVLYSLIFELFDIRIY